MHFLVDVARQRDGDDESPASKRWRDPAEAVECKHVLCPQSLCRNPVDAQRVGVGDRVLWELANMSQRTQPSLLWFVLAVMLVAGGITLAVSMSSKAHGYYGVDGFGISASEPQLTFTAQRMGRYEIDYDGQLGDLTFDVVENETGTSVPVREFGLLAKLFHTVGRRGYTFHIERPGSYQLSIQPWPAEAEVILTSTNTQAIALWSLGGIVLGGLPAGCGLMMLLLFLIALCRRKQESLGQSPEESKVSEG